MWNGWNKNAAAIQQRAYQLNKIESRYSLQGHATEEAVMCLLREKQRGGAHA